MDTFVPFDGQFLVISIHHAFIGKKEKHVPEAFLDMMCDSDQVLLRRKKKNKILFHFFWNFSTCIPLPLLSIFSPSLCNIENASSKLLNPKIGIRKGECDGHEWNFTLFSTEQSSRARGK